MTPSASARYSAGLERIDGVDVVRLRGPGGSRVSIAPRVGNNAFEFSVGGKNAFWFPYPSVEAFAASPELCGNPFLAPWANRLDRHGYSATGLELELNRSLDNYLLDQCGQPIHGLLLYSSAWQVEEVRVSDDGAQVTSLLEFTRHPDLMAQFPFAHSIRMTYRLQDLTLETRTRIVNESERPMPLSVGFHPYFQLDGRPRQDWRIRLAAGSVWDLNERFTPTGETTPAESLFAGHTALLLEDRFLDHVFGDLERDGDGWARFAVWSGSQRITVAYGKGFPVAVVYAPTGEGQSFICFEPMSGITNAFNLAAEGRYDGLPLLPPGSSWEGCFRVTVDGF